MLILCLGAQEPELDVIYLQCDSLKLQMVNNDGYFVVEHIPKYAGEQGKFVKYLFENLISMEIPADEFPYRVNISFAIDSVGCISDIEFLTSLNTEFKNIFISALSNSPAWKPGFQNGMPVYKKNIYSYKSKS